MTTDSLLNGWYTDLALIEDEIKNARETRWRGTTTRESQKTISALTEEKKALRTQINAREVKIDLKNDGTTVNHEAKIIYTASTLAWISVLLEALFEACIAYIWFYYYRSYVERKATSSALITNPMNDKAALLSVIQKLQNDVANLKEVPPHSTTQNIESPSIPDQNDTPPQNTSTTRQIGFHRNAVATGQDVLQHVATADHALAEDIYTIKHKDFRTGEIKRYTLQRVNNFIAHYENKLKEAIEQGLDTKVLENRKTKLSYWIGKRDSLVEKMDKG